MRKGEAHAFAPADPVFLHCAHPVGPSVQPMLHLLKQLGCVIRNAKVVPGNFPFFDQRAGAPAASVDDLLVGEHGVVHRIPVDDLRLAVGYSPLKHAQEQPLVPFVVAWIAGAHFARPVDGEPHRLHLLLHVGDVVVCPLRWRNPGLDRGVFSRHAEGIPAHWHEYVETAHAQVSRHHVVDRVVAHVSHVQFSAGIRQHRTCVELGFGRAVDVGGVLGDAIGVARIPVGVGGGLDKGGLVAFLHVCG